MGHRSCGKRRRLMIMRSWVLSRDHIFVLKIVLLFEKTKNKLKWAVVVAQLVEQLLPIPEVCSSNPVIGKKLFVLNICLLSTGYWKDENKEKEARNGPFFKIKMSWGWSNFKNSEIIHSDLIKLVTWLAASNHTVLFHNRVITLLWKFYLRCRNDLYIMY